LASERRVGSRCSAPGARVRRRSLDRVDSTESGRSSDHRQYGDGDRVYRATATSTAAPVTVTVTTTAGPLVANTIDGDPLVSARLEGNPPVPMAAAQYLEDQARGDGQAAWDELSVAAQQQIAQQGGSAIALTQELQRSPLPPILQITFAGGSTMIDGREAAVFIVTANVADTQRQVPYYFHQYQGPD
jgi:hypothetical protein